jgi:hypothetical protein
MVKFAQEVKPDACLLLLLQLVLCGAVHAVLFFCNEEFYQFVLELGEDGVIFKRWAAQVGQ